MVNYGGKGPKPTTHVQKVALVIAHVCAVVSVILVSRWANGTGEGFLGGLDWGDKNLVFNYHPVLMVTAFVFSFTEALLVYRTFPFSKRVNKSIHLGLQTLAVILASVGLRAVFKNHQETNKADLWSLHSWLGLAVFILFLINYTVGVGAFFFQLAPLPLRASILPYHVLVGITLYLAAIFTAQTGIVEKLALSGKCTAHYPPTEGGVHYSLLNDGCRLANWMGLVLFLTALAGALAVLPAQHTREGGRGGRGSSQVLLETGV